MTNPQEHIEAVDIKDLATKAAVAAGQFLANRLYQPHNVQFKGAVDLVTESDRGAEQMITDLIQQRFPHHQVLGEEGTLTGGNPKHLWVVDPLDGTTNYAHGYPQFSVSIAYLENNDVVIGVVYHPLREELFIAEKGHGAYLEQQRLKVSSTSNLLHSLVSIGFPYNRAGCLPKTLLVIKQLLDRVQNVRADGSAALDLCYVAAGRFDAFWENDLSPWDTAAGSLMVAEAGGQIISARQNVFRPYHMNDREILASNGIIHDELREMLANLQLPAND